MDLGRLETDNRLKDLEKEIRKIYTEAEKDLQKKLDKHFELFKAKDAIKRDQLARNIITIDEYKRWKIGQIAVEKRWESMLKNVSQDLVNADKIAKSIAVEYMPEVYAINMNYATYLIEKQLEIDTSFVLYSREAVEQIVRDTPELLPPPGMLMEQKIASSEAVRWYRGQIQSVTLQSIIQGESVPNMATRIAKTVCTGGRKSAMRYARTAITCAENIGKIDSYYRMESLGIKTRKTWVAALDGRTRDAHRELDGQTVDLDKPFKNSLGKIRHPGDPTAIGANVWNCRCTMISQIAGFETDVTDMRLRNTNKMNSMSYDEWKKAHGKSQDILMPDKVAGIMRARYIREYQR